MTTESNTEVTEYATWEERAEVKKAQVAKGYVLLHDDYDATVVGKGWLTYEIEPNHGSYPLADANNSFLKRKVYAELTNSDDRIAFLAKELGLSV